MKTELHGWRLAVIPHAAVKQHGYDFRCAEDCLAAGVDLIPATVPGNFELDLMRAGLLPDLYAGENPLLAQGLEDRHLWYFTEFETADRPGFDTFLCFGGVDTAAVIYADGTLLGETENMLIPYRFPLRLPAGTHTLAVHILPTALYTEAFPLPPGAVSLPYNYDQLAVRKAPYMFGWDIMPRIVSGGLWRPVTLESLPEARIEDLFVYTSEATDGRARLRVFTRLLSGGNFPKNRFTLRVEGACGGSRFSSEGRFFSSHLAFDADVEGPLLWMPKNYGQPNLYDVTATLFLDGAPVDTRTLRVGIRTVELVRTSCAGDSGEFLFRVNGQRIFCMGTNHVPVDAFPSREPEYLPRFLALAEEIGVNMIRCWGGSYYPCDEFYEFCDAHGILVWQDLSMACGRYPRDGRTARLLREETQSVVKRLRNHACLALWSGDNECDDAAPAGVREHGRDLVSFDPNENILTRRTIPAVLAMEDFTRPYLPSSPYRDEEAFRTGGPPSEAHLWGPRDFFKGPFYTDAPAHFASETGYHGCPAPESLRKFIPAKDLPFYGDGERCENPAWLLHSASAETAPGGAYHYRLPLMYRQVLRLFGEAEPTLSGYAMQSQISQAEAFKFFIERFRATKWRRTGILWWNLIDGWPQVSDAVTDWYGRKKLAFHYIKRAMRPFCLLCGESEDGALPLLACNDTRETVRASYRVTALNTGETAAEGDCAAPPDETVRLCAFPEAPGEFYLIEWDAGDRSGRSHYTAGIPAGLDFRRYLRQMEKAGFSGEFSGFDGQIGI